MAKTRQQVVTSALKELGVTPSQQGSGAGDFALVAEVFDGVLSELQAKELAAWGIDGTPNEAENAMALYVAQRAAHRVGTPEVIAYLTSLRGRPFINLVAIIGKKWGGGPIANADRF